MELFGYWIAARLRQTPVRSSLDAVRLLNEACRRPHRQAAGVAPLFVAPTHPRYSAFDWETWHELDVLRRELAPRFAAQKP